MWDGSDITSGAIILAFFVFVVIPPLVSIPVCTIASMLLPHVWSWVGLILGILWGTLAIFVAPFITGAAYNVLPRLLGWGDLLSFGIYHSVTVFVLALIPVLAMRFWSLRKSRGIAMEPDNPDFR